MGNKFFITLIVFLVIGAVGFLGFKIKDKPSRPRLGMSHTQQARNHIPVEQPHEAYNSDLPSSGPHYADSKSPTSWGVYIEEVPDEVFPHNEEHGGVVIAYSPSLPQDQIQKLQALFAPPYSNPAFKTNKAIVTPRSKNTKPIELASWTRTLSLDTYDEKTIIEYYQTNVGNTPEPRGGPNNIPINEAAH